MIFSGFGLPIRKIYVYGTDPFSVSYPKRRLVKKIRLRLGQEISFSLSTKFYQYSLLPVYIQPAQKDAASNSTPMYPPHIPSTPPPV
jgi:hypothetical protein